jgi:hypothetical protein
MITPALYKKVLVACAGSLLAAIISTGARHAGRARHFGDCNSHPRPVAYPLTRYALHNPWSSCDLPRPIIARGAVAFVVSLEGCKQGVCDYAQTNCFATIDRKNGGAKI